MSQESNPFASPQTMATDRPELIWAADNPEGLRKVKLGLTLVYAGICGVLLAVLSIPVLAIILSDTLDGVYFQWLLAAVALLLFLLMIAGQCFCLAVPRESGAWPLALASVLIHCLILAVSLLTSLVLGIEGTGATFFEWALQLGNMAAFACFLLFLRQVANYIYRPDVAWRAIRALVAGLIFFGWYLGALTYVNNVRDAPMGLTMLPPMIGMLVGLVMYANTVTYLRRAITV